MTRFDRPTLVTLTAPTASGKNFLRDHIEKELGWNRIVSTTTRAMRTGEVEGEDYYFISMQKSHDMEMNDEFAELINFRGTRYGVTRDEMSGKMAAAVPPMVILEIEGIKQYEKMCIDHDWDIFKIFIHAPEDVRLKRLCSRTADDIYEADPRYIAELLAIHTDRVLSITGDERTWKTRGDWDFIADGTNVFRSINDLQASVRWRNRLKATPAAYVHQA